MMMIKRDEPSVQIQNVSCRVRLALLFCVERLAQPNWHSDATQHSSLTPDTQSTILNIIRSQHTTLQFCCLCLCLNDFLFLLTDLVQKGFSKRKWLIFSIISYYFRRIYVHIIITSIIILLIVCELIILLHRGEKNI